MHLYEEIIMGRSNCYKIYTNEGCFFLKCLNLKFEYMLIQEVHYVNFLYQKGIEVYKIKKNKFNQYYTIYGDKIYFVELFQSGKVFLRNECPQSILLRAASTLGDIHKVSLAYNDSYMVMDYDWMRQYEKKAKTLFLRILSGSTDAKMIKDLEYRVQLNEKISDWFNIFRSITYGMSHGDYYCEQYCLRKGKLTIFDFTNCAKIPLGWEVINSYIESAKECKSGEKININNLDAYYNSYIKQNSSVKKDLAIAHRLYLCWCVMNTKGYDTDLGSLSGQDVERRKRNTRLCKYIYDNLDIFDKYFNKYSEGQNG